MNKGTYDLSYREMIESPEMTAAKMVKNIKVPDKVFRFRKLCRKNEFGERVKSNYWFDDVTGICKFSTPSSFCAINDKDDCKVRFDSKEVLAYMLKRISPKYDDERYLRYIQAKCGDTFEEYKASLQENLYVACFTTAGPLDPYMWKKPDFGDDGRGICIEYEVNDENFRPTTFPLLPVLYDDNYYDNTKAMKAVIDIVFNSKFNGNESELARAEAKMVCLGYGHTLIKPISYEGEQEWRLIIPKRKIHLKYFDIDKKLFKRDMTSAIRAIYMGYKITELDNFEECKKVILTKWLEKDVPVYQVYTTDKVLKCERVYA